MLYAWGVFALLFTGTAGLPLILSFFGTAIAFVYLVPATLTGVTMGCLIAWGGTWFPLGGKRTSVVGGATGFTYTLLLAKLIPGSSFQNLREMVMPAGFNLGSVILGGAICLIMAMWFVGGALATSYLNSPRGRRLLAQTSR